MRKYKDGEEGLKSVLAKALRYVYGQSTKFSTAKKRPRKGKACSNWLTHATGGHQFENVTKDRDDTLATVKRAYDIDDGRDPR